jgi:ATP-binding protein involved in chromosome partitioning
LERARGRINVESTNDLVERVMALTKDEVLASLGAIRSPEGSPLPKTGKLSDIVVSDGKVFFSISVDADLVPAWEPVRKAAEAAVRAIAGVTSVMVALTAER